MGLDAAGLVLPIVRVGHQRVLFAGAGAPASIHARIRVTAAKGTAVVFYSSDLDELASVSSRVLVVRASGSVFSEPERESIGHLLLDS